LAAQNNGQSALNLLMMSADPHTGQQWLCVSPIICANLIFPPVEIHRHPSDEIGDVILLFVG